MKRLFTYSLRVYDFIRDAVLAIFHYRRRTNVCILPHPHTHTHTQKKIIKKNHLVHDNYCTCNKWV